MKHFDFDTMKIVNTLQLGPFYLIHKYFYHSLTYFIYAYVVATWSANIIDIWNIPVFNLTLCIIYVLKLKINMKQILLSQWNAKFQSFLSISFITHKS